MGVGIPGTGMIGLPIAVALGALVGRSGMDSRCLKMSRRMQWRGAKEYISEGKISIKLCEDAPSNLHIEVKAGDDAGNEATAVISRAHTNFVYLAKTVRPYIRRRNVKKAERSGVTATRSLTWPLCMTSP